MEYVCTKKYIKTYKGKKQITIPIIISMVPTLVSKFVTKQVSTTVIIIKQQYFYIFLFYVIFKCCVNKQKFRKYIMMR